MPVKCKQCEKESSPMMQMGRLIVYSCGHAVCKKCRLPIVKDREIAKKLQPMICVCSFRTV